MDVGKSRENLQMGQVYHSSKPWTNLVPLTEPPEGRRWAPVFFTRLVSEYREANKLDQRPNGQYDDDFNPGTVTLPDKYVYGEGLVIVEYYATKDGGLGAISTYQKGFKPIYHYWAKYSETGQSKDGKPIPKSHAPVMAICHRPITKNVGM